MVFIIERFILGRGKIIGWFGSIFDAKESKEEDAPKEGKDGNYTYDKSETYGQSDYTVRERQDGTFDVYVKSDSERGHSHDHIDKDGNLLDNYHDCLMNRMFAFSEELSDIEYVSNDECIIIVEKDLKAKTKIRRR